MNANKIKGLIAALPDEERKQLIYELAQWQGEDLIWELLRDLCGDKLEEMLVRAVFQLGVCWTSSDSRRGTWQEGGEWRLSPNMQRAVARAEEALRAIPGADSDDEPKT